jgi:hypothetical protein
MADDAARALSMKTVPARVESIEDAWLLALREPRRQRESLEFVAKLVAGSGGEDGGPRLRTGGADRVSERASLAYAAAVLFACGKVQAALRVANEVLRQLNEHGRLYSTVDSVAALALLAQLRKTGVCAGGGAELLVNGASTTAARAAEETNDAIETVEVVAGVAVIEIARVREVRWAEQKSAFPLRIAFVDARDQTITRFARGDRAELVVTLPNGYVEGDVAHVCLPPSLSWVTGGARVKRFSVDFAGRDTVRVPVVVTGAIHGRQRFAVAVRNMFQEERAASPGLLVIEARS